MFLSSRSKTFMQQKSCQLCMQFSFDGDRQAQLNSPTAPMGLAWLADVRPTGALLFAAASVLSLDLISWSIDHVTSASTCLRHNDVSACFHSTAIVSENVCNISLHDNFGLISKKVKIWRLKTLKNRRFDHPTVHGSTPSRAQTYQHPTSYTAINATNFSAMHAVRNFYAFFPPSLDMMYWRSKIVELMTLWHRTHKCTCQTASASVQRFKQKGGSRMWQTDDRQTFTEKCVAICGTASSDAA